MIYTYWKNLNEFYIEIQHRFWLSDEITLKYEVIHEAILDLASEEFEQFLSEKTNWYIKEQIENF